MYFECLVPWIMINLWPLILQYCVCQICITTSTSAGLEQILPWIFYHKVIGVSNFFLFVEGKAASANVSKVLESIPVSLSSLLFHYILLVSTLLYSVAAHCQLNSLFVKNFLKFPWYGLNLSFSGGESYIQNKRIRGAAS